MSLAHLLTDQVGNVLWVFILPQFSIVRNDESRQPLLFLWAYATETEHKAAEEIW